MPAESVIEMATTNGVESIGLSNETGAFMPGRKADIILIDLKKPHLTPLHNPISHVVYAANGNDVDTVIVNGKVIMENREVKTIDEKWVMNEAEKRGLAITQKAGITIKPRWLLNKGESQTPVSHI
jgi:5-methylthioadenosine/S-adenosylhomocysteine deaminase